MLNKFLGIIVLAVFAAGCGVHAETYVITKDRVKGPQGNGGCLTGKCAETTPTETTRKVYVLELTKALPQGEVMKIEQEQKAAVAAAPQADTASSAPAVADNGPKPIVIPPIEDEPASTATTPEVGPKDAQSYTVLKDDTLQKIAKKFYGTYSKWTKIYEANKEKIKNPNFVKPGTVLTIPAVK